MIKNYTAILVLICTLFLMNNTHCYSQESEIKNLVFEGAGIRGIAYAGVAASLEENNVMAGIEKVGGTSAGATIALLIALGYSADEIEQIIFDTKIQKFNDGQFFFIGGMARMKNRFGWYKGEKLAESIGEYIENKTGNADITFEELYRQGYKDFYCTATCLNKQNLVILSRKTYPKMKVKDAVRISTSIPLYYQAVFVDETGKIYKKQNEKGDLDIMVDGGIIGNFPIQIFDEIRVDENGVKTRIPNYETIGIRMDSDNQIDEDAKRTGELAPYKIERFLDYTGAFYNLIIENLNRTELTEADWERTISVSTKGVAPKVKRQKASEKKLLVDSGKFYTDSYFEK